MRRTPIHTMLILAALAAALTGCSRMPTAPNVEPGSDKTGSSMGAIQVDDSPLPIETGLSNSVSLRVGQGATIGAGQFTLVIHKNSLKMPATITLVQPDPSQMQVEFVVTPAEANDFQVPLQLRADCSGEPLDTVKDETVYFWNDGWQEADNVSFDRTSLVLAATTHRLSTGKVDAKEQVVARGSR